QPIDRAMTDGPPQPEEQMRLRGDLAEMAMRADEDVLRQLLCVLRHLEHSQRHAVDRILIGTDQFPEGGELTPLCANQCALRRRGPAGVGQASRGGGQAHGIGFHLYLYEPQSAPGCSRSSTGPDLRRLAQPEESRVDS